MNEMHFGRFYRAKGASGKLWHKCYMPRYFMLHPSNFFAWSVDLGQSEANLEAFRLPCRVPDARKKEQKFRSINKFCRRVRGVCMTQMAYGGLYRENYTYT